MMRNVDQEGQLAILSESNNSDKQKHLHKDWTHNYLLYQTREYLDLMNRRKDYCESKIVNHKQNITIF